MNEDKTRFDRHLGPFADASEMAGAAQHDHGDAGFLRFLVAKLDCLRSDGLTKAILGVDECHGVVVDDNFKFPVWNQKPDAFHCDLARRPDDAVAVVAHQIRTHEVQGYPCALRRQAAFGKEDIANEIFQASALISTKVSFGLSHDFRRAGTITVV